MSGTSVGMATISRDHPGILLFLPSLFMWLAWVYSQHVTVRVVELVTWWLTSPRGSLLRALGRCREVSYDVTAEVTKHHFCKTLIGQKWVREPAQFRADKSTWWFEWRGVQITVGSLLKMSYSMSYQLLEYRWGIEHSVLLFLRLWIGKGTYNAYFPALLTY